MKARVRKISEKIKSPQALLRTLKGRKKAKVVFTNGCFDLIHRGHVSYLEQAKKLGDVLVVALNTDESVRRQGKGPDRPINRLADRLEVMAALEAVDYVTWFEEDTPFNLIELLKPQVLVKGGDWSVDKIVGGRETLARGGRVKSLPYIEGQSTTQIIERARAASK